MCRTSLGEDKEAPTGTKKEEDTIIVLFAIAIDLLVALISPGFPVIRLFLFLSPSTHAQSSSSGGLSPHPVLMHLFNLSTGAWEIVRPDYKAEPLPVSVEHL